MKNGRKILMKPGGAIEQGLQRMFNDSAGGTYVCNDFLHLICNL